MNINGEIEDTEGTKINLDELMEDEQLFDYVNVASPQNILKQKQERFSIKTVRKPDFDKNMAISHENTLSMTDMSHSTIPSQRPTTQKNIKLFCHDTDNNTERNYVQNVSLAKLDENMNQECIGKMSNESHLDYADLEQHLNLLQILTSQGLMHDPLNMLHSHQKLHARSSNLDSKTLQKSGKYRRHRRKRDAHNQRDKF